MIQPEVPVAAVVLASGAAGPLLRLDESARALYRRLRRAGPISTQATRRLMQELGEEPLRQLVDIGLVREQGRDLVAVPRGAAVDRLLDEQATLLQTALGEVRRRQQMLRTLTQAGPELDGDDGSEGVRQVSVLDNDPMSAVPAQARHELVAIQPGGRFPQEVLEQSLNHARHSRETGVRLRVVHQAGALAYRDVVAYFGALEELGAQVRVRDQVPFQMLIVDRDAALCEVPSASSPEEAFLIRGPRLVGLLHRVFESAWVDSIPFRTELHHRRSPAPDRLRQSLPDVLSAPPAAPPVPGEELDDEALAQRYQRLMPQQQLVLRYLAEGQTDVMIARRTGVTSRTVSRRIAAIYQVLGVESRFQAGVVAHRLGMV